MDQDASFEDFPWERGWRMMLRGERDAMVTVLPTSDRERICSFPNEPLDAEMGSLRTQGRHCTTEVFLIRRSRRTRRRGPRPGCWRARPTDRVAELWEFLREHHTMVETSGGGESLRMLAAGHVDYAVVNLTVGRRDAAAIGLSGKVEPILSRSVIEDGFSVCFSKASVSPSLVEAFSRALKDRRTRGV